MNTPEQLLPDLQICDRSIEALLLKRKKSEALSRRLRLRRKRMTKELRVLRAFRYQTELELCRTSPPAPVLKKLRELLESRTLFETKVPERWRILIDLGWGVVRKSVYSVRLDATPKAKAAAKLFLL